jgi:nickel transport protein
VLPAAAEADLPVPSSPPTGLTEADIEQIVDTVLDRKLKPIRDMLADSKQSGPNLRDILGGLGYIVGLVGLAAYIQYRRSKKPANRPAAGDKQPASADP